MFMTESLEKIVKEQEDTEENKRKAKEKEIDRLIRKIIYFKNRSPGEFYVAIMSILLGVGMLVPAARSWIRDDHGFATAVLALSLCFIFAGYEMASKTSITNYIFLIKKLFLEISSKPFEVRIEKVKGESKKLKVVIEKNLLIENSHVIKEKSEHLTAYIDSSQSAESVISMICVLVKKAEEKFS